MTTRTIPLLFPLVNEREIYSRKTAKGSIMRRLAMMQNWIWAKFVKVYAGHGYEGHGNALYHIKSSYGTVLDVDTDLVEAPDAGQKVLPLCSFAVPPNWGASRRLKIQGKVNLAAATGSIGEIIALISTIEDEASTSVMEVQRFTSAGDDDIDITLEVPQDKMYQCQIFLRFLDGSTTDENDEADGFTCYNISARYETGIAVEIGGDEPQTLWKPTADTEMGADHSYNAAILQRILRNTLHIYTQRPPELCQAWLGPTNNPTSTYAEVGRYTVWLPDLVTGIKGKLVVQCTHGGAGNEVRVKVDGSVVETFTSLSAGISELDVTAATGLSSGAEHTITIEAKSTAADTNWGTIVNGVSFWEDALTVSLGDVGAAPATFQPTDEDGLRGDDPIVWDENAQGQRVGLKWLILNDRWLAYNRLRHLIGDWRHRCLKRDYVQLDGGEPGAYPGADWTRGVKTVLHQTGRPKNITIHGYTDSENDVDALGGDDSSTDFADGTDPYANGYPNDNEAGLYEVLLSGTVEYYSWPKQTQFFAFQVHGRRLAKHWIQRATGAATLQQEFPTNWVLRTRGRRARPAVMENDYYGHGPLSEEHLYRNKAYFHPLYNTTTQLFIPIKGNGVAIQDHHKHWQTPLQGLHTNADNYFTIRGRLLGQAGPVGGVGGATVPTLRKEGEMFEVELNSVYLADVPLSDEALEALT